MNPSGQVNLKYFASGHTLQSTRSLCRCRNLNIISGVAKIIRNTRARGDFVTHHRRLENDWLAKGATVRSSTIEYALTKVLLVPVHIIRNNEFGLFVAKNSSVRHVTCVYCLALRFVFNTHDRDVSLDHVKKYRNQQLKLSSFVDQKKKQPSIRRFLWTKVNHFTILLPKRLPLRCAMISSVHFFTYKTVSTIFSDTVRLSTTRAQAAHDGLRTRSNENTTTAVRCTVGFGHGHCTVTEIFVFANGGALSMYHARCLLHLLYFASFILPIGSTVGGNSRGQWRIPRGGRVRGHNPPPSKCLPSLNFNHN